MLILAFITALSFNAQAGSREIREYSELNYDQKEAQGYTSTVVKTAVKAPLRKWIKSTTEQKLVDWEDFVLNGEEYDHLSPKDKAELAANPLKELRSILDVQEISEIRKDGVLIGYFIEVADQVQAAIYQDGAWYELYTDPDMRVVVEEEHSS